MRRGTFLPFKTVVQYKFIGSCRNQNGFYSFFFSKLVFDGLALNENVDAELQFSLLRICFYLFFF